SPIANTGCSWKASQVTVTVSIQNEKMFGGAKRNPAPGMTKTSVSGVGDEAIFIGAENFSSLWVRKGTTYLLVRIYGVPVGDAQTKLKALAIVTLRVTLWASGAHIAPRTCEIGLGFRQGGMAEWSMAVVLKT